MEKNTRTKTTIKKNNKNSAEDEKNKSGVLHSNNRHYRHLLIPSQRRLTNTAPVSQEVCKFFILWVVQQSVLVSAVSGFQLLQLLCECGGETFHSIRFCATIDNNCLGLENTTKEKERNHKNTKTILKKY